MLRQETVRRVVAIKVLHRNEVRRGTATDTIDGRSHRHKPRAIDHLNVRFRTNRVGTPTSSASTIPPVLPQPSKAFSKPFRNIGGHDVARCAQDLTDLSPPG